MVVIYKAPSILERDAILNLLEEEGIKAFGVNRDMHKKMTNSSVDLNMGAASAHMDGFAISVSEEEAALARDIVQRFLNKIMMKDRTDPAPVNHLKKFYASSTYTLFLPVFFHGLAFYQLWKGIKNGEKVKPLGLIGALIFLGVTGVFTLEMLYEFFNALGHFKF